MTMRIPHGYLPRQSYNEIGGEGEGFVIFGYTEYLMAREWRIFQIELDMYGCVRSTFEYI